MTPLLAHWIYICFRYYPNDFNIKFEVKDQIIIMNVFSYSNLQLILTQVYQCSRLAFCLFVYHVLFIIDLQISESHKLSVNYAIGLVSVFIPRFIWFDLIKFAQIFAFDFRPLQWRHNGRDGVLNHQPNCLLNRLFRRSKKKTSKLRVTGLCAHEWPVTREMFPVGDVIIRNIVICVETPSREGGWSVYDNKVCTHIYMPTPNVYANLNVYI